MAFRTKKISQMDPKGSNLASTDLLEISQLVSGSYVTKSITGAEIISGATTGFVPTTRTLTINGTTQDLSADRTFTISTGITIGTTAITSGTVGRVLFEGTGNVVQESAGLTYNDTTRVFTLLGPINSFFQHTPLTNYVGFGGFQLNVANGTERAFAKLNPDSGEFKVGTTGSGYFTTIYSGGVERFRVFSATGNIGINTTTDAGFKLDVNGTARVQGSLTILTTANFGVSIIRTGTSGIAQQVYNSSGTLYQGVDSSAGGFLFTGGLPYASFFGNGANFPTQFGTNGATRMTIFNDGNIGVNTTTNAGYKLDVNGTARISVATGTLTNQFTIISSSSRLDISAYDSSTYGVILRPSVNNGGAFVPLSLWGSKIQLETSSTVHISAAATGGNASAILDVTSTTKGFLPPRMTTTQKNAIATPATGLMVYDNVLNRPCFYDGTTWITL